MNNGNLNTLKTGDEVTTIRILSNGETVVNASINIIGEVTDEWARYVNRQGKLLGRINLKTNGKIPQMYEKEPYYFSNNPEHLKLAEKAIERERKAAEKKDKEDRKKLEEFIKKHDELCKEYGASFSVYFGPGSDTHGIYGEAVCVTVAGKDHHFLD